jgi:hypothetical protein
MYVRVDLASVPPVTELREADDLTSLKVIVKHVDSTYLSADTLRELAGSLASDPGWQERFAKMLDYAQLHGWVREDGAVRAHVEPEA